MDIEQVREICLSINPHIEECSPFAELGHPDIAFKIAGKIFAYLCVPDGPSCHHADDSSLIVLKSDPDKALELRDRYVNVVDPAWHWNKKYWNQVHYRALPSAILHELIEHPFNQVAAKLPKKPKKGLGIVESRSEKA